MAVIAKVHSDRLKIRQCFRNVSVLPRDLSYIADATDIIFNASFQGSDTFFKANLLGDGQVSLVVENIDSFFYDPTEEYLYYWDGTEDEFQRRDADGQNRNANLVQPPLPSSNSRILSMILHPNKEEFFYAASGTGKLEVYRAPLPYDGTASKIAEFAHNFGPISQMCYDIAREVLYVTNPNNTSNQATYIYSVAWDGSSSDIFLNAGVSAPLGIVGVAYDPKRDLIFYTIGDSPFDGTDWELRTITPDGEIEETLISLDDDEGPGPIWFNVGGDTLYLVTNIGTSGTRLFSAAGEEIATLDTKAWRHMVFVTLAA